MNDSDAGIQSTRQLECLAEHEILLHTFQDFRLKQALTNLTEDVIWDLRAAAAFLTDRLATHAPTEEGQWRPGTPQREAAALEHSLLRAETASFIADIATLDQTALAGLEPRRRRLLRRVHRIELLILAHADGARERAQVWHRGC